MTKFFNWKETKGWYIGIVIAVLIGLVISPFLPVNPAIAASGVVSIDLNTIEQTIQPLEQQQSSYYSEPTVVQQETWGYKYTLSSGDLVEVGDSRVPEFKAHIKTIRDNSWFSLGWSGGIFTPSLNGLNVSFNFNASTQVNIYPAPPSERLPDGGIEYDIKLLSRPTGNPDITLDIDWSGITWQKLLALDVEYPTEVACVAAFGSEGSPYVRTPTTITGADGVTYKKRAEYEVNSYLGTATSNRDIPQDMGINKTNGQPIVWHNLSTTKLFIHRGEMTDALGQKAWVEDINLDETAKTITFTLPRTWLRNAAYPVSQVCGVDPAYTQTWASFQSTALSGDGIWTDVDTAYNSAVLSMVLSNATTGTENTLGVRANGSLLSRHITLHEAEGGGQTHCRMFVQTDANGIFEAYHSDVSDADYFYYSGYWTNVTFTNTLVSYDPDQLDTWRDTTLIAASAGLVAHFIIDNAESDVKNIMGVRANGSSLERKISVHEPESGGSSYLDLFTKVDSSCIVELYSSDTTNTNIYLDGYFDSGLDFVELWQNIAVSSTGWQSYDITAYLDQDGRMADFLLTHGNSVTTGMTMGARDGDDSSTARTLVEGNHQPLTQARVKVGNAVRRLRADSVTGMVEAIADANLPLPEPPAHVRLRDGDRVFWEGIICARARGEWLPNDLVIAVQLARCQADIERESLALEGEGAVVTNDRGTLVANARFSVMGQLVRLETELMRNLRICGSASGNAREDASRRRMQMRGATLVGELADDELLAI